MNVIRLCLIVGCVCALSNTPAVAQSAPKPPQPKVSTATKEKAADQNVNPDTLVLVDFQKRIDAYMAIHNAALKQAPPLKETKNPAEIKTAFGTASILGTNRVVFNICGNKYRLIVRVNYAYRVVYIRFIGTHAQYDRINVEEV